MKKLANILEIVFLVGMLMLCVLIVMAGQGKVPYLGGYRVLQVISDSMKPTISSETCIVIKQVEEEDIKVGDIITFVSKEEEIKGFFNTHRVHEIVKDDNSNETLFVTKGDKYEEPDAFFVSYEQVAGRYVGELPLGEWVYKGIRFLSNRTHYFVVVIAPLFLCCMSYMKQLFEAIFRKEKDA